MAIFDCTLELVGIEPTSVLIYKIKLLHELVYILKSTIIFSTSLIKYILKVYNKSIPPNISNYIGQYK